MTADREAQEPAETILRHGLLRAQDALFSIGYNGPVDPIGIARDAERQTKTDLEAAHAAALRERQAQDPVRAALVDNMREHRIAIEDAARNYAIHLGKAGEYDAAKATAALVVLDRAIDACARAALAQGAESVAPSVPVAREELLAGLLRETWELADNWPGVAYTADLESRIEAALGSPRVFGVGSTATAPSVSVACERAAFDILQAARQMLTPIIGNDRPAGFAAGIEFTRKVHEILARLAVGSAATADAERGQAG